MIVLDIHFPDQLMVKSLQRPGVIPVNFLLFSGMLLVIFNISAHMVTRHVLWAVNLIWIFLVPFRIDTRRRHASQGPTPAKQCNALPR